MRPLYLTFALSLALHLSVLNTSWLSFSEPRPAEEISLVLLPPKPAPKAPTKRVIVPDTPVPTKVKPVDTNQLSEKDSAVEKEQLARGEAPAQVLSGPNRLAARKKPQAKKGVPKKNKQLQKTPSLVLSRAELSKLLAPDPNLRRLPKSGPNNSTLEQKRVLAMQNARAFQRLSRAPAFRLRSGVPDYLPQIPDGDITLLNSKADKHAVFVRRVALQVFGSLRKRSWAELASSQAQEVERYARVLAKMSLEGEFVTLSSIDSSGNPAFDKLLSAATEEGLWDQNPPHSAVATDGTIQFIFQARIWSRKLPNTAREQRWLMLGTGLR